MMVDESQTVQNLQCIPAWSDRQLILFDPNIDHVPIHFTTVRAIPIYACFDVPGMVNVNFFFILPTWTHDSQFE